ncbi:MAG: iron ABC transporter permease [Gammaproteobacteria bacterium AqS3]|nr:iron ABC transporter permease [Gammaproteobacteria bacterium AqS3]
MPVRSVHRAFAAAFTALILLPIGALLYEGFSGEAEGISAGHLWGLGADTLILAGSVALAGALIGAACALTVALFDFPGRGILQWALAIPLTVPAYVLGYVFVALAETPHGRTWLPGFREHWGIFLVLAASLYPYSYLFVRSVMGARERGQIDAARALGTAPVQVLGRVIAPRIRRALLAAGAVIFVEVVADLGTVAVFNYDTLTTGIFQAWHGMFSFQAAVQLGSLLLLIAAVLIGLEAALVPSKGSEESRTLEHPHLRLGRGAGWTVSALLWTWLGLISAAPLLQLLVWGLGQIDHIGEWLGVFTATAVLAVLSALILTGCALLLVWGAVRRCDRVSAAAVRLGLLGYGIPGAVLAVGLLIALGPLGLIGSLAGLLAAYLIRFSGPLLRLLEGPVHQLGTLHEEAAQVLGEPRVMRRIALPLLRGPLLLGAVLALIEVVKEMPMTLILRPLGWDTLAVKLYGLTVEGEWQAAALPALLLLLLGALPMWLLQWSQRRSEWLPVRSL